MQRYRVIVACLSLGLGLFAGGGVLAGPAEKEKKEDTPPADAVKLDSYEVGTSPRRPKVEDAGVEIERPQLGDELGLDTIKPQLDLAPAPTLPVLPAVGTSGKSQGTASSAAGEGPKFTGNHELRPLKMEPPDYPREAMLDGREGYVVVEYTVNTRGETQDIVIVEAEPRGLFEAAARRAVSRWTFQPYVLDGVPQPKRVRQRIDFKL
ncbi:MAG TPA: TonB family protein [Gammaproteobacteria bacterium]|nr:TonB family protein [Gammaproteobacteria bacterium]